MRGRHPPTAGLREIPRPGGYGARHQPEDRHAEELCHPEEHTPRQTMRIVDTVISVEFTCPPPRDQGAACRTRERVRSGRGVDSTTSDTIPPPARDGRSFGDKDERTCFAPPCCMRGLPGVAVKAISGARRVQPETDRRGRTRPAPIRPNGIRPNGPMPYLTLASGKTLRLDELRWAAPRSVFARSAVLDHVR